MYIKNGLAEGHRVRVHETAPKPPPTMLAGSYLSLVIDRK
jgi:hypothetical protein